MMNKQNGLTLLQILIAIVLVAGALIGIKSYQSHQATIEAKAIAAKEVADKALKDAAAQKQKQLAAEKEAFEYKAAQEAKKAEFFKSFDVLADTVKRWDDAVTLASSTPRMSLPERIADLQKIKQDTEGLMVSLCLSTPKSILLRSMGPTIDGFLIFLHNKDHMGDILSTDPMATGQSLRAEFGKGFSDCKEGIENQ